MPYSATMSRSTAAWCSPTSHGHALGQATWCATPGCARRRAPTWARAVPPPRSCTPLISRAAMPAILETTVSAIAVRPCARSREHRCRRRGRPRWWRASRSTSLPVWWGSASRSWSLRSSYVLPLRWRIGTQVGRGPSSSASLRTRLCEPGRTCSHPTLDIPWTWRADCPRAHRSLRDDVPSGRRRGGLRRSAGCERPGSGTTTRFGVLVDRHGPMLRYARRLVGGSEADAGEVVQEAFISAWRSLDMFRGESSLRTWRSGWCTDGPSTCNVTSSDLDR